MREGVERFMEHKVLMYDSQDTHTSAVFFVQTSIGSDLSDILYFLVVWLEEIFCSTESAVNFGDQDISKCLNNHRTN